MDLKPDKSMDANLAIWYDLEESVGSKPSLLDFGNDIDGEEEGRVVECLVGDGGEHGPDFGQVGVDERLVLREEDEPGGGQRRHDGLAFVHDGGRDAPPESELRIRAAVAVGGVALLEPDGVELAPVGREG